jgi:hypothetical protein
MLAQSLLTCFKQLLLHSLHGESAVNQVVNHQAVTSFDDISVK